uniref:DNA/RNA-binding domain-containing protein n=1 Tax=Gibberella zeae TaxID=5518 RepID=A0A4E9EJC7_GIBZA
MEHIVYFAYIPNLDYPLQWGYFSCVMALVILGLVFAALGFVKCHEVYEMQAPRIGIADPDPSNDEKHHALFPGDSVVSPTERLSLSSYKNDDDSTKMIHHLEMTPISDDQLIAEVQGIYAGLVVVETKCIEVDNELLSNNDANLKLNSEQWQALIALHRTLLNEHYDFFLASQHPSASPALRSLASKHAMPARMWRHGIHSFLELLRHRLPDSLEHMLTFLYSAYSMMALLYETVPAFEGTWMECLGDLSRYRIAIEDDDIRAQEVWTDVSRHWYSKVSEKSPTTGRLYHHLAILARHNALQELYLYTKSLCVPIPYSSARETIMTLFGPLLSNSATRLNSMDASFILVHGILFSGKSLDKFEDSINHFNKGLSDHIAKSKIRWREAGYHIAITLTCSLLGYGAESNVLMRAIFNMPKGRDITADGSSISDITLDKNFKDAYKFGVATIETVLTRHQDANTLPFLHTILVFIRYMTRNPAAMRHLENDFPWAPTATMLNFLLAFCKPGYKVQSHTTLFDHHQLKSPLPEDFAMRGLLYSEGYPPKESFENVGIDADERYLELESMTEERTHRVLSLGFSIAHSGRWLIWDEATSQFSAAARYSTP